VDDGSKNPEPLRTLAASLPRSRLIRHEHSMGLVQSRHQMASLCETEFLISLDDDSYFLEAGQLPDALAEFDRDPRLALLSFRIVQLKPHERRETQFPEGPLYWFRGCGYMLRVNAFRDVGGYPAEFIYGGEETHLTMQLYRAGHQMRHFPQITVEHQWSGGARDRSQMEYNFTRGQVLVKLFNEPLLIAIAGVTGLILKRLLNAPQFAGAHLSGWLDGIRAGLPGRFRQNQLTWNQYRALRQEQARCKLPEKVEPQQIHPAA